MWLFNINLDTISRPLKYGTIRLIIFYLQVIISFTIAMFNDLGDSPLDNPGSKIKCFLLFTVYSVGSVNVILFKNVIIPSRSNRIYHYFAPMFFVPKYFDFLKNTKSFKHAKMIFKQKCRTQIYISLFLIIGVGAWKSNVIYIILRLCGVIPGDEMSIWIYLLFCPIYISVVAYYMIPVSLYLCILANHIAVAVELNSELYWCHHVNSLGGLYI